MRRLILSVCLICAWVGIATSPALAEVAIAKSSSGWELTNGHIRLAIVQSARGVQLSSLRREGGAEWAVSGSPLLAMPDKGPAHYQFADAAITDWKRGGKQLALRFKSDLGGLLSLMFRMYPTGAVIELATKLENQGQRVLLLNSQIDPLFLTLRNPGGGLKPYSAVAGQHGFHPAGNLSTARDFDNWLVLENGASAESALIGGEPGLGVLGWKANVRASATSTVVRAGTILLKNKKSGPPPVFELGPEQTVETPISFLALANGDTDEVGNETFRYLKQYVFQTPLPDAPWVTYCIWLTERNSEETILRELTLAKRVGFDVFYHDATWSEGASIVPGMNDWSKGLGSYEENKEKFPHGIKNLSAAIHGAGMKFGIWVDPGNVDAARVESGEIPAEWIAMIDGKPLGTVHPSLSLTRQLCLGDPKVVAWLKTHLAEIIEKWGLDWIKWDPSATVSYECNRTDHGHGRTDGAYAAYRGRLEIMRYLLERFPSLSGFECDPSLQYSRTNPGPKDLLPGGYTNEFMTGPMVSPNVWGSLATAGHGDAGASDLTARWYSASALDYHLRKRLLHGVSFGNINGMSSQLLSAAPPGFVEAFQRNLLYFKQYRHLLLEDVYHPKVGVPGWSSIQYVKADSSESVVYVFRDNSPTATTTVQLRGLDPQAKYRFTSLNDRPGRDRTITGDSLMKGVSVSLPDKWLAQGDGVFSQEFAGQLRYGSDILLLRRLP